MDNMEERFSHLASLIGEKARAKMLWHLTDGRAYTARELACIADISQQSGSNHLKKLLDKNLLRVEKQGRHKYYRLYDTTVAEALEGLAYLSKSIHSPEEKSPLQRPQGIQYARSCYDHLAGYLGVTISQHLLQTGILYLDQNSYFCTEMGQKKFCSLGIEPQELHKLKRKFAYPCLDWSERKHHIGGALGAALLQLMLGEAWLRRKNHSRELILTVKGSRELEKHFNLRLKQIDSP